jgi:predicted dehydrogenase
MFRVGLVDLCTSHPGSFVPLIREHFSDDVEVTAVWDGGSVRPEGYAREFAAEHHVPTAPATLAELVESVDAGIVHSADWDLHLERARPFIQAGKPVLIDKPAVGRIADLCAVLELQQKHGTPVLAGSSLRYAFEVAALRDDPDKGDIVTVFASGPMSGGQKNLHNYGIHTVEMFQGLAGVGVRCVSHLGAVGPTEMFRVEYVNGPIVLFQVGTPQHQWHMTVTTTTGIRTVDVLGKNLYRAFVTEFVRMLKTGAAAISLEDSLEAVRISLAADQAQQTGRTIYLGDLGLSAGFDGHAFAADYARGKR